jgi:hypothetical protein
MRKGIDAPTLELPAENVEDIRAFLDEQSRFKLAMWVRHEQAGAGGPLYDHHLVLAVDDEDWATGDIRALDAGMHLPAFDTSEKTWIDIYPFSEVDALRSFGSVLWEQVSPGADPLDYRFTYEPVAVSAETLRAFQHAVCAIAPEVVRVTATRSHLWKGDTEIEDNTNLCVACDLDRISPPGPLRVVQEAARDAGIVHSGGTLDQPGEPPPYATVLYTKVADR